jgi:asparagine synthase (glutamine-hydrolysing)
MCGIFSLLNVEKTEPILFSSDFIKKQFMKGSGRGPEFSSMEYSGSKAMFGFHRLAINGLNMESNQPLKDENILLICNGEIYNYKELYNELQIEPNTDSDCEVIIHLYKRFGIERTLQILDGVFAFILLDYNFMDDMAKIFVCRDPFGVRPLYFLHPQNDIKNSIYGFASELKCLSEFHDALSGYTINHIQPGTYSRFDFSYKVSSSWKQIFTDKRYHTPGIITTQYYNFNYQVELEKCISTLQHKLIEAVEKRCITTQRPIACLLSGGLDSSLITALVNDFHKRNKLPTLETYSIGMPGSVDLKYAKIVAEYLGTKHTEVLLTEKDFIDAIPEVIEKIESYDTTTVRASIGNYLLGKYIAANSEAKVIFNGDGSDELTGGYLYFYKAPNAIEFDSECRRLLQDIHLYDVLRSDKSISSHGLEPRTPFLDREWVQTYLSVPSEIRFHVKHEVCEKHLLRSMFSNYESNDKKPLLPYEVLWRTKEAFSDGVSQMKRSLFQIIQEYVAKKYVSKNTVKYQHLPPQTLEQEYYREIFESKYKGLGEIVPYFWMPRFIEGVTDASARTLNIYKNSNI